MLVLKHSPVLFFCKPAFYLSMEWKPQPLVLTFGLDGCFEGCSVPISIKVWIGLHCGICTWRERMLEGKGQKEQKILQS